MTVVAYKDGVMVADGASFAAGLRFTAMHQKVITCALGLAGAGGLSSDCQEYRRWMCAGMPQDALPDFSHDTDEPFQALWAKLDGTLWWADERLRFVQIESPGTLGETNAAAFVEGAMRAGASAEEALRLALKHCTYVGGEITVVRLPTASLKDGAVIARSSVGDCA